MLIIALLLIGLIVGSFLNVVIYRLPRMIEASWGIGPVGVRVVDGRVVPGDADLSLAWPRSFCPSCGHRIRAIENIPLISYLWLRGRCSDCSCRIPVRYPLVELGGAAMALLAGWHFGLGIEALGACLLGWTLLAASAIDIETRLLPDPVTLSLLWLGLAFNLGGVFVPLSDAVVGAMVGYLFLWLVYRIYKLLTGKEGMGYGDFKLQAALGAWLGWQHLAGIVFLSCSLGTAFAVVLIIQRARSRAAERKDNDAKPDSPLTPPPDISFPFGPFLALAGLHALYIGDPLEILFSLPPLSL